MKLHTETSGRGENILFVHGLWGGGDYFKFLEFNFAKGYKTFFVDQLGFGKSDKPLIDYTLQEHAKTLVGSVGSQKFTLIGHSLGCNIALEIANSYPEKVYKLILISPPFYETQDDLKKRLSIGFMSNLTMNYPIFANLLCKIGCSTRLLSLIAPYLFKGKTKTFISGCTNHTWHSYKSTFDNCLIPNSVDKYKNVFDKFKTLIVYSDKDRYINTRYLDSLRATNLKKLKIAGVGHSLLFTKTYQVDSAIQNFLR